MPKTCNQVFRYLYFITYYSTVTLRLLLSNQPWHLPGEPCLANFTLILYLFQKENNRGQVANLYSPNALCITHQHVKALKEETKLSTGNYATIDHKQQSIRLKKLSNRWGTAQCVVSVETLPSAKQQCRNYLYDKSWTNRSYEVGRVKVGRCVTNMCTQLRHLRAAFIVYWRHKQTEDGRVVDITCILTTCCGEIF